MTTLNPIRLNILRQIAHSPKRASHYDRIMTAVGTHERISTHDIALAAGLSVVQVDRRIPELIADGRLVVVSESGAYREVRAA